MKKVKTNVIDFLTNLNMFLFNEKYKNFLSELFFGAKGEWIEHAAFIIL